MSVSGTPAPLAIHARPILPAFVRLMTSGLTPRVLELQRQAAEASQAA